MIERSSNETAEGQLPVSRQTAEWLVCSVLHRLCKNQSPPQRQIPVPPPKQKIELNQSKSLFQVFLLNCNHSQKVSGSTGPVQMWVKHCMKHHRNLHSRSYHILNPNSKTQPIAVLFRCKLKILFLQKLNAEVLVFYLL